MGTSGDYPPFSDWPEGAATPRGFSVDVARAWSEAEGRQIEWVRFTWRELERDLEEGRFDIAISGITVRPDRSIAGRFSTPLTTSGAVVLVRAASPITRVKDLDRSEIALAVNSGGHLERVARSHFPLARIEPISRNGDVLEQIERRDIAGIVTDTVEAPRWLRKRPGLRPLGPFTADLKAAWFPQAKGELRDRFDQWLMGAERDGSLDTLRARHGLVPKKTAKPAAALLARLDERLSLMREVARLKSILDLPIEDREREERVLDAATQALRDAASQRKIPIPDAARVQALYRAQIEAAKSIQRSAPIAPEPAADSRSVEKARHRLDGQVRPALIDLGDRIAELLVACLAEAPNQIDLETVATALQRHALGPEDVASIHRALRALLMSEAANAQPGPPRMGVLGKAANG